MGYDATMKICQPLKKSAFIPDVRTLWQRSSLVASSLSRKENWSRRVVANESLENSPMSVFQRSLCVCVLNAPQLN